MHSCLVTLYISVFSLTTVLGAGVGMAMLHSAASQAEAHSVSVTVMQGIATGSLLYVVFFEVRLFPHITNMHNEVYGAGD